MTKEEGGRENGKGEKCFVTLPRLQRSYQRFKGAGGKKMTISRVRTTVKQGRPVGAESGGSAYSTLTQKKGIVGKGARSKNPLSEKDKTRNDPGGGSLVALIS